MALPTAGSAASPTAPSREGVDSSGDTESADSHHNEGASAHSATGNQPSLPPLSASWRREQLSQSERDKAFEILKACGDRDLDKLRDLATSEGGLVEDEIRRTAWPILLGCDRNRQGAELEWHSLGDHGDEHQVELDVNRSFVHYPQGETEKRKDERKHELSNVITEVLRRHPMLHYFQGYHDIVQVLLLALGANAAVSAVARLSLLRIRDFMLPTMAGTTPHLDLVKVILYAVDPDLAKHLSQTHSYFALAPTLTMYAHDIEQYSDIARLFDFLLASEAVVSLYLFAAIIMSRKAELLEVEPDDSDVLYAILSKLPRPLNLERLIRRASEISTQYPPESLPGRAWWWISANSVLKTTHGDPQQLVKQTLTDGERMFQRHAADVKRVEVLKHQTMRMRLIAKKYRRPATYTAATVFIAVMALVLGTGYIQPSWTAWTPLLVGVRQKASDYLCFA